MGWGLCPPPARGDGPLTAGARLPFPLSQDSSQSLLGGLNPPLPGQLTEPPGETHSPSPRTAHRAHSPPFTRTLGVASCLGSSGRLVPLERIQPPVTRAAFLGPTHTCSSTPRSDQKGPLGPRAPGSVCHSPPAWPVSLTAPAGSPGASTAWGRLPALSWGGLRGVRFKKQQVPVGPPTHSTAASTRLPTSSLWMGPGGPRGSH